MKGWRCWHGASFNVKTTPVVLYSIKVRRGHFCVCIKDAYSFYVHLCGTHQSHDANSQRAISSLFQASQDRIVLQHTIV